MSQTLMKNLLKRNTHALLAVVAVVLVAVLLSLTLRQTKDTKKSFPYPTFGQQDLRNRKIGTAAGTSIRFYYPQFNAEQAPGVSVETISLPNENFGDQKTSGVRVGVKTNNIDSLIRLAKESDVNSLRVFCTYPRFDIELLPDTAKANLADFLLPQGIGNRLDDEYIDDDYLKDYGIQTHINGHDVILVRVTEDKSLNLGYVKTRAGIVRVTIFGWPLYYCNDGRGQDQTDAEFWQDFSAVAGSGRFDDFRILDIIKSVAYLNE